MSKKTCCPVCRNYVDVEEIYEQGRADAFKEIAYSDNVIKEPFEILAYNKGRIEAIDEMVNALGTEPFSAYVMESVRHWAKKLKEQNK